MEFRMIELPSFKAVSSGVDTNVDFSDQGILGKFNAYFSKLSPRPENSFIPRDFLMFDHSKGGHIITPKKIIEEQGWAQMESFIPIRLLNN